MRYQKTRQSYWYHLSTKTYELSKKCTFMYLLLSFSVTVILWANSLGIRVKKLIETFLLQKVVRIMLMHHIKRIQNLFTKVLKFLIFGISLNINLATSCLILTVVIFQQTCPSGQVGARIFF